MTLLARATIYYFPLQYVNLVVAIGTDLNVEGEDSPVMAQDQIEVGTSLEGNSALLLILTYYLLNNNKKLIDYF